MRIMVNSKTRLDIGYGYMHIWVISGFISRYNRTTLVWTSLGWVLDGILMYKVLLFMVLNELTRLVLTLLWYGSNNTLVTPYGGGGAMLPLLIPNMFNTYLLNSMDWKTTPSHQGVLHNLNRNLRVSKTHVLYISLQCLAIQWASKVKSLESWLLLIIETLVGIGLMIVLMILKVNYHGCLLHTTVTVYGRHNGSFFCIL
jgi:hypothetical protein